MIIRTPRTRADLKAIHAYIARDSRQNAKRVTDTLAEPTAPAARCPPSIADLRERAAGLTSISR